jgi:hypothetical protein
MLIRSNGNTSSLLLLLRGEFTTDAGVAGSVYSDCTAWRKAASGFAQQFVYDGRTQTQQRNVRVNDILFSITIELKVDKV